MSDKKIPFSKPFIDGQEENEVLEVLRSGWLTTGNKAHEFEESVKRFLNVPMAVATSSCTSALEISLAIMGCGGCDVITTPFTFASTVLSIIRQGGHPVLVDIDPKTFNIDPGKIEEKIKSGYSRISVRGKMMMVSNTTARILTGIIPVHYGGYPADMGAISRIAEKYGLWVIEDAAHAMGSNDGYAYVGASTGLVCFSFYANKNITTGEGGMIVSAFKEKEDLIRAYTNHGLSKNSMERHGGNPVYDVTLPGYKANLSDINAAVGVAQMEKLPFIIHERQRIKKKYDELLWDGPGIRLPWLNISDRASINFHLYPVTINNRDAVLQEMGNRGISCSIHFQPVHTMVYFKKYFGELDLPYADEAGRRVLSLPIYPGLTDGEIEYIATNLIDIVGGQ